MNAVGTASKGNVQPIVDHHAAAAASRDGHYFPAQARKVSRVDVPLTNLQDVNACFDGEASLRYQALAGAIPAGLASQPPTIGHEMQDQERPSTVGAVAETLIGALHENRRELGEARNEIHESESADRTAHEVIAQN
jgi:hypothetical protein